MYGCPTPSNPDGGTGDTPTTGCTTDADCGAGKVCDTKLKACFKDCTASGVTCDLGDKCDTSLKRCVCDAAACAGVAGNGCHPSENVCAVKCANDGQCTGGKKCIQEFCQDATTPTDACQKNEDCKDPAKPVCQTTSSPKVCIPQPGECDKDADCQAKDPNKKFCDTAKKLCVECLKNEDCGGGGKTCDAGLCKGPAGCTDTATCHAAVKKSFCDGTNTAAGCKPITRECTADFPPKDDNSAWDTDIEQSKGSIIWNSTVQFLTAAECWSKVGDTPCTDDGDCSGGAKCFALDANNKFCGKENPDGTVEVTFAYYNKNGAFSTARKGITTHRGEGFVAGSPATVSGDATAGKLKYTICIDKNGKYGFFATDNNGDLSNSSCYEVAR